jgi:hypothetical protein
MALCLSEMGKHLVLIAGCSATWPSSAIVNRGGWAALTEIAIDVRRPPVLRFNSGECLYLPDEQYTVDDLAPALCLLAHARGVPVPELMRANDSGQGNSLRPVPEQIPVSVLDRLFDGRQRSGIPDTLHRWDIAALM